MEICESRWDYWVFFRLALLILSLQPQGILYSSPENPVIIWSEPSNEILQSYQHKFLKTIIPLYQWQTKLIEQYHHLYLTLIQPIYWSKTCLANLSEYNE